MDVITVAKRRPVVFALACVAAVAMMFISEGSYRQAVGTLDKLGTMGAARTNIQALERNILVAETAQRGYMLTGRREHLLPFEKARAEINESFKFLRGHYGGDSKSTELIGRLQTLTENKMLELAVTIARHEEGERKTSREIVLSDAGRENMNAIRAISVELLELEALKVTASGNDLYRTLMLSRIGMAILSALSLLALYMYLRQTFALKEQQQEAQRLVRIERDRLEIEVKQRTAQLTELTHHLQTAREDERNRLARNLHDELGALLTSAKLDAARVKSRLVGTAPEALERLNHLVGTLNSSIALGRRIIEDLRPSTLSNLGLVETLEILAREFGEGSGVQVHCALALVRLDADAELMIYRLVQEAITNISKYARASQVWIGMATHDGQVEVTVRDNGVGFDPAANQSAAHGLLGMRFRVEAEGGTLAVVSAPGQGTLLELRLPEMTSDTA